MSSRSRPEFFFDRSLGKETARLLREAGWVVHLIADHYPNDAQEVDDDVWIDYGCSQGWAMLSKDKAIRYRGSELAALHSGCLFCLANGNLLIEEMAARFVAAEQRIIRAIAQHDQGFWRVYDGGRIELRWP